MADEDAELIGGIAVSIGASHSRLVSDLAEADRILEKWAQQKVTVAIGAQVGGVSGGGASRATSQPVSFGPGASTRAQAQQGQTSLDRAINEALAKTGERYNAITGEIEDATQATRRQRAAVVEVQQAAAKPIEFNIDTGPLQNDLNTILATMREIVATAQELGSLPAGGGGGGKRRRGRAAADEDEEEGQFPRIQYVDQIERQRRQSARGGVASIDINRSEQALTRQRMREEQTAARQRAREEAAAASLASQRDRALQATALQSLTDEIARDRPDARASSTFAPQLTDARRAELALQNEQNGVLRRDTDARRQLTERLRRQTERMAAGRREDYELPSGPGGTGRGGGGAGRGGASATLAREEAIERRGEARRAVAEAQAVTAARTARTQASGLGGFFGGTTKERLEATSNLTEAEQKLAIAQRRVGDYEAQGLTKTRAYAHAREELATAETNYGEALNRVEKLSSFGAGFRNLIAVTAAGAAFGVGLQAINTAFELTARSAGPAIDRMTGFATVAGRVTDVLSEQTRSASGNAAAVIAMAESRAALSAQSSAIVSPLVTEQTAIEAGNKNLADAVDLFQTYQKIRQQGLAGLTTQTGGFLGSGFFGTRSTAQEVGRLFSGLPSQAQRGPTATTFNLQGGIGGFNPFGLFDAGSAVTTGPNAQQATNIAVFAEGLRFANEQLAKGGENLLRFTDATGDAAAVERSITAARLAGAPDEFVNSLRDGGIAISGLSDDASQAATQIRRLLESFNIGSRLADPSSIGQLQLAQERQRQRESAASVDAIRARQEFELPAIIGSIVRQQQFASNQQLPVQSLISALANPNLAVGTGIAAGDRGSVAPQLAEANSLQDELNTRYERGRQVVRDTYRPAIVQNFGAAAGQAFDDALRAVEATGQRIATISQNISNEQAAYQVAQYNFQLQIARRTLGDIAGLTGQNYGVEATRLGLLQRENLELSRQGQMLQFNLSQRQINFQQAVAGFQAPGITPEERQANIRQAQIEADFAQKQLDIQREMFGNQVEIVDISNLRQGVDLLRQIELLQQGRQLTINTAAAEQQLLRLNQLQQGNVAQVGTYIEAVNGFVSTAFSHIAQLEAAAGKAMVGIATAVLGQFGIFLRGLYGSLGAYSGGFTSTRGHEPGSGGGLGGYAQGGIFNLSSPTRIGEDGIAGEVADETLIILSRPRSASGAFGGGGTVNFNGDFYVRSEADIDAITRKVMEAMGNRGSQVGLRTVG